MSITKETGELLTLKNQKPKSLLGAGTLRKTFRATGEIHYDGARTCNLSFGNNSKNFRNIPALKIPSV